MKRFEGVDIDVAHLERWRTKKAQPMIIVGIDPGLTGAIGVLRHKADLLGVWDMPTIERHSSKKAFVKRQVNGAELEAMLCEILGPYDRQAVHVFLETPVAFPGQHISTTASCWLTAGIIEGVLAAKHYAHTLVSPKDWKKALKLTDSKEQARALAIRKWPDAALGRVKDHNRAEALLIALYGHGVMA